MTTGQRIREERKKAGLTQKKLGERIGVAYQTVAQWENDLRNPKPKTLQRIADALSISVLDIMSDSEIKEIEKYKKDGYIIRFDEKDNLIRYPDDNSENNTLKYNDDKFSSEIKNLSETAKQALKGGTSVLTEVIENATKVSLFDVVQELSDKDRDALLKYAIVLKIQEKLSKEQEGDPGAVDSQEDN